MFVVSQELILKQASGIKGVKNTVVCKSSELLKPTMFQLRSEHRGCVFARNTAVEPTCFLVLLILLTHLGWKVTKR